MPTIEEIQSLPKWRRVVVLLSGFFGFFAALCTIFCLVVTAAEGWQEHLQAQWPETTAQVQSCGVDLYTHARRSEAYWIDCSITYLVHGEPMVSHVHSQTVPAPRRVVWEYPAGQFEKLLDWANEHPHGTPIKVSYDPTHPTKAVLLKTDMPRGGPSTPNNLRLLEICTAACVVLLTISRIARMKGADASVNSPASA